MLLKTLISCGEKTAIITFTEEQARLYVSTLNSFGVDHRSVLAAEIALLFVKEGRVNSLRVTDKTKEQLMEEFKRDYNVIDQFNEEEEDGRYPNDASGD